MKQEILSVIIVLFLNLPQFNCAIQCYKCLFANPVFYTNQTINLCKDFDHSDKFIVDCPYSTFCMKKIFSAKIPALINGTERDCAHQKLENQNYKNGKWQEEISVEEPYKAGCFPSDKKGQISTSIEYCYCKGDLCNSSSKLKISMLLSVIVFIKLIVVFYNL